MGEPHQCGFYRFLVCPEIYKNRVLYHHNPQVTLMRTNKPECETIGKIIAEKCNANSAQTAIMLPLKGVSVISVAGQPFYDQSADTALFNAIRRHAKTDIIDFDETINSAVFSTACAYKLLDLTYLH